MAAAIPTFPPSSIVVPIRRTRVLLPQEVMVKDYFTGNLLCAEFRHEKIRTNGKGDRYKVYHPMFAHGYRYVRHGNFKVLGMAASEQDALKHAQQHDLTAAD